MGPDSALTPNRVSSLRVSSLRISSEAQVGKSGLRRSAMRCAGIPPPPRNRSEKEKYSFDPH